MFFKKFSLFGEIFLNRTAFRLNGTVFTILLFQISKYEVCVFTYSSSPVNKSQNSYLTCPWLTSNCWLHCDRYVPIEYVIPSIITWITKDENTTTQPQPPSGAIHFGFPAAVCGLASMWVICPFFLTQKKNEKKKFLTGI